MEMMRREKRIMKYLQYAVFSSNQDFLNWQQANPQFGVYSAVPIMTSGSLDAETHIEGTAANINYGVGVFVLYGVQDEANQGA
jgi:hypothetical protein